MARTEKPQKDYDPTATYVFGFIFSILLTIVPYMLVVNQRLTGNTMIIALVAIALSQMIVQLYFFLHLGSERKPRWNLLAFLFMALVVLIVVVGSLWIMNNLNYNMHPQEVEKYIQEEELIDKSDTR